MANDLLKKKLLASTLLAGMTGGLWAGSAIAQEAPANDDVVTVVEEAPENEVRQDTVVITGSRLSRPADNTVAITTIGAQQIDARAFTNPIEAIEEIPFVGAGTNLDGANNQFGDNSANPDLLNLQTNRTLTLVNGRRFVSSNQATVFVPGNANGSQVDLTLINPSLIQSTDLVIGSGGSAVYGADAVAGVVNIILKDDYEGVEGSARYGVTDRGDGDNYRLSVLAGKNFLDGRANITVAGEYFNTDGIRSNDDSRLSGQQLAFVRNPLNTGGSDGMPASVLLGGTTNQLLSVNGALAAGQRLAGSSANNLIPNAPLPGNPILNSRIMAFVDAGLRTPWAYSQTAAGQAIDPNLWIGTFGDPNLYFTVPNTDSATSALFPNRAVPLQFSSNGDLIPYNIGNIFLPADQNTIVGGDGLPNGRFANVTSDQERTALNALTRFDVTNNITWSGEFYYADVESTSFNVPASNVSTGGSAAGGRAIPIYVDQNPYLSEGAIATLNNLEAQGAVLPTLNGERVVYLNRSLLDVTGVEENGSQAKFFRIVQSVDGEFEYLDRNFNWDVFALYGEVTQDNFADELFDVEFALATDVVLQNGTPVCRQQTLDTPEAIDVRNPGLSFINTTLPSLVPTQAQIDACQPLNLLGFGSPSRAAIDYVSTNSDSRNQSSQLAFGAQFGGEVVELPAGNILFSVQAEYRKEENDFIPGASFGGGLARNTQGRGSSGESEFTEYGLELSVPIFGGDFTFPGMHKLVFDGAVRRVERESEGGPFNFSSSAEDTVFNVGGRWSPHSSVTLRGSISEAVRSPSIVELFGAGVTGFSGLGRGNLNPCDSRRIDGDDAGVRRTNCEAFATQIGLDPATYLPTFLAPGGAAPAAGASNPGLENEKSESWTAGIIFEPHFIDGLTLTLDYYELDLEGEIGLTGLLFDCFDSPNFPSAPVGGFDACNALIFAVEDTPGSGNFIVPATNPINGQPVDPIANPGSPAQDNVPLTSTFAFFPTLNLGATEIRSWYGNVRYDFELASLLSLMEIPERNYGTITLNGSAYLLETFDESNNGTFTDLNPRAGEPGDPELTTVLQITHRYNKLTHSLQWFRTSDVLEDVESSTQSRDQNIDFARPEFHTVNYNASYDINDRWAVQFVVNNVFDEKLKPKAGLAGDTIGRRYVFGVRGRF